MSLPALDSRYLQERWPQHKVSTEAGMICIVIPGFPLPRGLNQPAADLLVRLSGGYPDVPPDMWWFNPPVQLACGSNPPATDVRENHLGQSWQRWSRHFSQGQWRSGVDCLESFLGLIHRELQKEGGGE